MIEDKLDCMLAVSLHAPDQELRQTIVPNAKVHKLGDLMSALIDYSNATGNRLFYEYIMIKGITD
jgi:23S rRNA (adenine2503-C2)-methyltransferase